MGSNIEPAVSGDTPVLLLSSFTQKRKKKESFTVVRGSCDFGRSNLGLSHVKHDFCPLSNLSVYMPLGEVLAPEVIL